MSVQMSSPSFIMTALQMVSFCVFFLTFSVFHGQSFGMMSNSTDCPMGCDCIPDTDVENGTEVRCTGISAVPDFWPEGTSSVRISLLGNPGIPSGAFSDMVGLCTLDISGDVGIVATGAFDNLVGDGCDHTDRPISQNRLIFLSANVTTIQSEAFTNVQGFEWIQFVGSNGKGRVETIQRNAFKDISDSKWFTFEYMQIGYLEDTAFTSFRNIDTFLWEASTLFEVNRANVGPFSDFINIKLLKFEQLRSPTEFAWEHAITSNLFTGIGSGVEEIMFLNFNISIIEPRAFENVHHVRKITFDDVNCENITTDAFFGLQHVEEIHFKGFSPVAMNTMTFQQKAFQGAKNISMIKFEQMDVDLNQFNFENAEQLGTIFFNQSAIPEGDSYAFLGLNADSLIFDCVVLPKEGKALWMFGTAQRLENLSFKYDSTCPFKGEAWLDFASISRSNNISNISFQNVTIKNIDRLAIYDCENINELSFTDCTIERSEPNAIYDLKNVNRITFRRVKWELFLPHLLTDIDSVNLIEFDDVDLGENGILPMEMLLDVDGVNVTRLNNMKIDTFSTRAFGWDGSSSNLGTVEILNSQIAHLQSFAFPGLSNVGTFRFQNNVVDCVETGAFMNMRDVYNYEFSGNEMACEPIFDVPWHMDWEDRKHCRNDADKQCLVVTPVPTAAPTDPPTPQPTPDNAAGSVSFSLTTVLLGFLVLSM